MDTMKELAEAIDALSATPEALGDVRRAQAPGRGRGVTPSRHSDTNAVIDHLAVALGQEEYELLPGDARRLAGIAVNWANDFAAEDPKLGNGRDVRAVFALAEGFTIGAMAWREAERRAAAL